MAVARYAVNGIPDSTFSDDGAFEPSRLFARCLATQSDGAVIVGADDLDPFYETHFKLRRLAPNGALDVTFGPVPAHFAGYSDDNNRISDVQVGPNDEIYVGVSIESQYLATRTAIAKYTAAGVLDLGFATNGEYVPYNGLSNQFFKMGFLPNGDLLLVQAIQDSLGFDVEYFNKLLLTRLSPAGSPVSGWGINGQIKTDLLGTASLAVHSVSGLVAHADGGFSIRYHSSNNLGSATYLARFQPGGALDPTFNGNGVLAVPGSFPTGGNDRSLVALADGSLIHGFLDSVLTFQRFLINGTPDPDFGVQGSLIVNDPAEVAVDDFSMEKDPFGNVVVAGTAEFKTLFPRPAKDAFIFKLPMEFSVPVEAPTNNGAVRIFPNPANSSQVLIDVPDMHGLWIQLELFDIWGRIVAQLPAQRNGGEFMLSIPPGLMDGTYFLRISAADRQHREQLIILRQR